MPGLLAQNVLVIVDPFSSGRFLVDLAYEKNIPIVCVKSSNNLAEYFYAALQPEKYIETIDYNGDIQSLSKSLEKYHVQAVIAGSEPGVELADELSATLDMPTANESKYSAHRRDKYLMNERIREFGLRAANQSECYTAEDAVSWARTYNKYPVVVKPTCSLGTDGVFFCNDEREVENACLRVLGKVNPAGQVNEAVVIQEFLNGTEYVVDTVSHNGEHHVTDVWRYTKQCHNGSKFVYHGTQLLPYDTPERERLQKYVFDCITALGIRYGPTHCEIMWVPEEGPILVEVNSRMHGASGPKIAHLCKGHSQIDLTLDVYTSGDLFRELSGKPWKLLKHSVTVDLISKRDGILMKSIESDAFRGLESFNFMSIGLKPGDRISKTVDLLSSPGYICLIHEDLNLINEDVKRIRDLEAGSLYEVEESVESGITA
eukprot:GILK01000539.1.p1 GENE.GILK01000539.1~~GILK01000539.1.p1  ORF type:complete len:431 (-),score=64.17 GILK01000539.1:199-1491(-)